MSLQVGKFTCKVHSFSKPETLSRNGKDGKPLVKTEILFRRPALMRDGEEVAPEEFYLMTFFGQRFSPEFLESLRVDNVSVTVECTVSQNKSNSPDGKVMYFTNWVVYTITENV